VGAGCDGSVRFSNAPTEVIIVVVAGVWAVGAIVGGGCCCAMVTFLFEGDGIGEDELEESPAAGAFALASLSETELRREELYKKHEHESELEKTFQASLREVE
jgi:hypothetical protein